MKARSYWKGHYILEADPDEIESHIYPTSRPRCPPLRLPSKGGRKDKGERITPALVLRELRAHNFAVLSTVNEEGAPDSAGVNYGVSPPGRELALYVMTRRHLKKARNIARNPRVSLVVPLQRRVLQFVPPATIQLCGRAEILDWTDPEATEVFRRFWIGRRILAAYNEARSRGETRVCFLRIVPDPVIRTYAVGYRVWELAGRMGQASATIRIPSDNRDFNNLQAPASGPHDHLIWVVSGSYEAGIFTNKEQEK